MKHKLTKEFKCSKCEHIVSDFSNLNLDLHKCLDGTPHSWTI
jgi:hypothetical protein